MEQGSEVARVMRQIDLELEAAQRGISGFASTARHEFINARMQRGGERILRLIDEGKHDEAQALMNADNWGIKGREKDEETTRQRREKDARREKRRRTNGKQGRKKDETKTGA